MILSVEYEYDCKHKSEVIKSYDFDKEVDMYRYDSFIQFNKPGNEAWCPRCQKQKSLIAFKVSVIKNIFEGNRGKQGE